MITPSSRYARNRVVPVTDEHGVTRPTILPLAPAAARYTVQYYTWSTHDRVDLVALRFYGSEQLWWLFAQANPQITNWAKIPDGTLIRIPDDV
jgi:phage tail protein X